MREQDYFSADYHSARTKFLKAAKNIKASVVSFPLQQRDLDSKNLYIDAALFGPVEANKLILVFSGIHGIEGYAGSAIQIAVLENLKNLAMHSRVALIHAVNPWGMACGQRWNADNIDLNRNANADGDSGTQDNILYRQLENIINPQQPYASFDEFNLALQQFSLNNKVDLSSIQTSILGGQQQNPAGIFYRGTHLSAELNILFGFLRELDRPSLSSVTALDIHTGIGEKGSSTVGTLFSVFSKDQIEIEYKQQLAENYFTDSTDDTKHIVKDMPQLMGITHDEVRKGGQFGGNLAYALGWCFKHAKVNSFILELGTQNLLHEIYTLINANSLKTHFFTNLQDLNHSTTMLELREAFNPADPTWRAGVIQRGLKVYESLIHFSNTIQEKHNA